MAKKSKVENIKKYRRSLNIGIVIFLFILLYVVILVIQYFSRSHLQVFDVQEASLAQDNIVTGLIVRKENVLYAKHSGYLNYYFPDHERVQKNAPLFSIDETRDIYDTLMNDANHTGWNDTDAEYLRTMIQDFRRKNPLEEYDAIPLFLSDINSTVQEIANGYSISAVNDMVGEHPPSTFHMYHSDESGLISYNTDDYCGITLDQVKPDLFTQAEDFRKYKSRKHIVAEGSPVLKYITEDTWYILCVLNESQKKALKTLNQIDFTICEDGFKTTAPVELIEIDAKPYAMITMTDYIQNYLDLRFLSIELRWQVSGGYKIPLTAITEKEFYIVPIEFFTRGGNSNQLGIVREQIDSKTGTASYDFVECMIYHDDGMYYYINPSDFTHGEIIYSSTGESYTLQLKESLEGVYNINKGYALFRRIERITQNKEYCIISKDTEYGIHLYDHIALNAADAVDSGIIY